MDECGGLETGRYPRFRLRPHLRHAADRCTVTLGAGVSHSASHRCCSEAAPSRIALSDGRIVVSIGTDPKDNAIPRVVGGTREEVARDLWMRLEMRMPKPIHSSDLPDVLVDDGGEPHERRGWRHVPACLSATCRIWVRRGGAQPTLAGGPRVVPAGTPARSARRSNGSCRVRRASRSPRRRG